MTPHVEKIRVPVRLSQPNLDPRDGWLLLFPRGGAEARGQTLLELLNSPRNVIPFIQSGGAGVLLLVRINIDWVAVGAGVAEELIHPPRRGALQEQRVELRFIDEGRVDAVLEWPSGKDTARLSDFLNASGEFLAARAGFGTLIVNKQRIRETRIVESLARAIRY